MAIKTKIQKCTADVFQECVYNNIANIGQVLMIGVAGDGVWERVEILTYIIYMLTYILTYAN